MSEFTIRPFRPDDAEAFIGMGKWLQENSDFKGCGFSPEKVFLLFVDVIENPDYFGIMVDVGGEVAGVLFGRLEEYYFSHERFALDSAFALTPKYRYLAKTALPKMLGAFEEWAKDNGAIEVAVATSTLAHGEKLQDGMNALGYKTVGFTAKKRFS